MSALENLWKSTVAGIARWAKFEFSRRYRRLSHNVDLCLLTNNLILTFLSRAGDETEKYLKCRRERVKERLRGDSLRHSDSETSTRRPCEHASSRVKEQVRLMTEPSRLFQVLLPPLHRLPLPYRVLPDQGGQRGPAVMFCHNLLGLSRVSMMRATIWPMQWWLRLQSHQRW